MRVRHNVDFIAGVVRHRKDPRVRVRVRVGVRVRTFAMADRNRL